MKALVVYLSQTGNTKKVAEAIFDELPCDKDLRKIEELNNLEGYDIIIAGFPVWQFGPAEPARKFLAEHAKGKNIALFVTHAMDPSTTDTDSLNMLNSILKKCRAAASEGNLAGFFNCQGELSENIAAFLLKNSDPVLQSFGAMRNLTIGHPDSSEIDAARRFAKDLVNRIS